YLKAATRPFREIVALFLAAGRGLAAAHQAGIVHRDFKPENVIVGKDGRPRVTDFGLAGVAAEARPPGDELGPTQARAGTPAYMAPEQHLRQKLDARADQFAFCVGLFQTLVGQRPFAGSDYAELRANVTLGKMREIPGRVPARIRALLRRGLSVAPADRFPSMEALLADLARDPTALRRQIAAAAAI